MDKTIHTLGLIVIIVLILAIARILSETNKIYFFPDAWGQQFVHREGFVGANPAPSTLDKPRESYAILRDVLPTTDTPGNLTTSSCYDADFAAQSNKTGNYIQRDNNYTHKGPDSCSSPRTEFVNSFYLLP